MSFSKCPGIVVVKTNIIDHIIQEKYILIVASINKCDAKIRRGFLEVLSVMQFCRPKYVIEMLVTTSNAKNTNGIAIVGEPN